jgi:cytochrome c-type biogenesis protein CcmH/NrfF
MALSQTDKKEIEGIVKKEMKDFLDSNTTKQFEEKLIEKIRKELKKGKLEGEIKDLIVKSFREFFTVMYQQRSFWESRFKNA